MKRWKKRIPHGTLLVMMAIICTLIMNLRVKAESITPIDSGNYRYQIIDETKKEITILKIFNYGEKVEIPSEIDGYRVTSLGTIKDIDDNVEDWLVFVYNDTIVKELLIPEGVLNIGPFAFMHLQALETLQLPESLEKIQYGGFTSCTNLKEVSVPKRTYLSEASLSDCNSLETVVLRSTNFEENVFSGKIKRMVIPDDASTSIGIGYNMHSCTIDELIISPKIDYVDLANTILSCHIGKLYVKASCIL